MDLTADIASLNVMLDRLYPATGRVGFLILLNEPTPVPMTITANTQANEFATAGPHGLVSGSRVRLSTTGLLPVGFNSGVDYSAIVTSVTTFKLALVTAPTIPLAVVDVGSGASAVTAALIDNSDRLEVLLAKELRAPGYARYPIVDLGKADGGKKPLKTVVLTNQSDLDIVYTHHAILIGGSSVIGDGADVSSTFLYKEVMPTTLVPAATRTLKLYLELV